MSLTSVRYTNLPEWLNSMHFWVTWASRVLDLWEWGRMHTIHPPLEGGKTKWNIKNCIHWFTMQTYRVLNALFYDSRETLEHLFLCRQRTGIFLLLPSGTQWYGWWWWTSQWRLWLQLHKDISRNNRKKRWPPWQTKYLRKDDQTVNKVGYLIKHVMCWDRSNEECPPFKFVL